MKVTLMDVREKFDALISGSQSREAIAAFAAAAMQANDWKALEMEPAASERQIWRAITYLSGVDLLDQPTSYLHSVEDFEEFRRELGI